MKAPQKIAIALAILATLWIASGLFSKDASNSTPEEQKQHVEKPLVDVRIRESIAQDYDDDLLITGRSRASREVHLKAEIDGALVRFLKEEGDMIQDGEVLAELEIMDREAKVKEAKQRVNQRTIEYNAAKKLEGQGFNSKIRLAQAAADLEDAKATLKQTETDLAKTKITSPFDGVIFQQDVEVGDYLKVGDGIFALVDLDPIEFVGFAPERDIQSIKINGPARIVLLNGDELNGTVSYIAPAANEQTRTFRIIVSAPNEDLTSKAGLTARIYVPTPTKKAHKITPSILSLGDDGQIGVKIVNDQDIVEFVPISILSDKTEGMWISGPPEKTRIITVGQEFVTVGQKVHPVLSQGEGLL